METSWLLLGLRTDESQEEPTEVTNERIAEAFREAIAFRELPTEERARQKLEDALAKYR